jgi:hypothetical protein
MRRIIITAVIVALVAGMAVVLPTQFGVGAGAPAAQEGEMCSPEEIAKGEAEIKELPPDSAGIVSPAFAPDMSLYVVVVTLPPETCVGYHSHQGAISLVVYKGSIDYAFKRLAPGASVKVRAADAGKNVIGIEPGTSVALEKGSWVTQDQQVDYTYRNPSESEDAVVVLAGYVDFGAEGQASDLTEAAGYAAVPIVQATPGTDFTVVYGSVPGCGGGCRKR